MSQASTGLSGHERRGAAVRSRYLETAEAAAYLRTSESHFRAQVRAGKLPKPIRPYGPNGKCLWDEGMLDEHMRELAIAQGAIPPAA